MLSSVIFCSRQSSRSPGPCDIPNPTHCAAGESRPFTCTENLQG